MNIFNMHNMNFNFVSGLKKNKLIIYIKFMIFMKMKKK